MKSKCKVKLKGHKFDLEQASEYFNTNLFSICEIGNEYYISSDAFNDLIDTNIIISLAAPYIEKANAILKLKLHDYKPIELDNFFLLEDENGTKKIGTMQVTISGRSFVTIEKNPSEHEREIHKKQTENLLNNSVASEIFHFYSKPTSWINLYKIFEIIKDNIGEKKIIGFLTRPEINRFTGTAQSKAQIGDEARHASDKYKGHSQPMTIQEADALIKRLIINWIENEI
jgi:hypothetical protein